MIEITIREIVVPAVRMTTRSKYVDPDAIAYLSNKQILRWYMAQAMDAGDHQMYDKKPLAVTLEFFVPKLHQSDLDNLTKSVLDAMQGIVFKNDNYVDFILVTRRLAKEPKVKIKVELLEGECLANATPT